MAKKRSFLDGYKTYDISEGFGDPEQWRDAFCQRMSKDQAKAILERQNETAFGILGRQTGTTEKEIKSAFRKLIQEWHPDKNPHRQDEAKQMSITIIAAYESLRQD
jgi:DnaJ-class molecular chaperone